MTTKITLGANQKFVVQLASRTEPEVGLRQFGWIYVTGEVGSASVQVLDTDSQTQPKAKVPIPGLYAAVIRESSSPRVSEVIIEADSNGFRGEFHFELLKR